MASVPIDCQTAPTPPIPVGGDSPGAAANPIPVFIPREEVKDAPYEPLKAVAVREYSDTEKKSLVQLADVLGMDSSHPLAAVIPFPVQGEDKALAEAKTVEEAMPLIGNMIKAEKQLQGVKKPYPRVALKQQHIVAYMLCNPFSTTTEICSFFSISPTTLSNICKSDTFKSLVQAHRVTLDSGIGSDLQQQLRDTMAAAVEVVQKAVVANQDPEFALEVLDKTANRLGMGAKHQSGPAVQVNVISPEMIAAALNARRGLRRAD